MAFELEAAKQPAELTPPEAVVLANSTTTEDRAGKAQRQEKAKQFVTRLAANAPQSPEFAHQLKDISTVGSEIIRKTSTISTEMLNRPINRTIAGNPQLEVANTLQQLRQQITQIDPERADLKGIKKIFKWMPAGNKVEDYFNRYETAESHLNAIIIALSKSQDDLYRDNAYIEVYKRRIFEGLETLKDYNELLTYLEEAILEQANQATVEGRTELATRLNEDALPAVRQRRVDVQTHIAVTMQGYMSLELVQKNNNQLIIGVEQAQTTTVAAMATAYIVAQALGVQQRVTSQLKAANDAANQFLNSSSNALQAQNAEMQNGTSNPIAEIEKLEIAFKNVVDVLDTVDNFYDESGQNLAKTMDTLNRQIERSKAKNQTVRDVV